MAKKIEIKPVSVPLHTGQQKLFNLIETLKYVSVCCGRRWGKSLFAAFISIYYICKGKKVAYLGPNYSYLEEPFRFARQYLDLFKSYKRGTWGGKELESKQGGLIKFISVDNGGEKVRSKSWDLVIIDEAALIGELDTIINEDVRPGLLEKKGKILMISTPKSRSGTFYQIFEEWERLGGEYGVYTGPSIENPYLPLDQYLKDKAEMSEAAFQQEYEAIPSKACGKVFLNTEHLVINTPTSNVIKYYSVDLGLKLDFCAVYGWNEFNEAVFFKGPFKGESWPEINEVLYNLFGDDKITPIIIDNGGPGCSTCHYLKLKGYNVVEIKITPQSKPLIVTRMQGYIASGIVKIHKDISEYLLKEMESYQYITSDKGYTSYNARAGKHDDCVIAFGLFPYYLEENGLANLKGDGSIENVEDVWVSKSALLF